VESPDWTEVDAYRAEHDRLTAAAEHVARAVAELLRAREAVGDHASAVALRDAVEGLQMIQAQVAAASEKAFSLGQLSARRARHAAFQHQVDQATTPDDPPSDMR
jgi:alpha-D-ribose 1-methylphosphonate 5-triphosphate synthase subunit PhnG